MSLTSLSERITIATSGPRRSIRIRTRPFFFFFKTLHSAVCVLYRTFETRWPTQRGGLNGPSRYLSRVSSEDGDSWVGATPGSSRFDGKGESG